MREKLALSLIHNLEPGLSEQLAMPALTTRTRSTILHSLTTTFRPGTVTALMGPSGSGKTSLLSVVAGLVRRSDVSGGGH